MIRKMLSPRSGRKAIAANLISVSVVLTLAGCERGSTIAQSSIESKPPQSASEAAGEPAKTEPEAPLLLLDDAAQDEPAGGATADNSRCFVCHVNYMTEQIAVNHARHDIGCVRCHGSSDAHIADESWGSGGNGTAPDIMYPRDRVNPACMTCHPQDKLAGAQHETLFGKSEPKVCTDCHGDHRLSQRRCKWR